MKAFHVVSGLNYQIEENMKFSYYPETDSLYIDLSSQHSVESKEISEGIVLDYDKEGNVTGIDIDNASRKVNLEDVSFSRIPFKPAKSA